MFTGHMIDSPGRGSPRFPPELEAAARRAIAAAVDACLANQREVPAGIASGARGGDMLFHEVCREKGMSTAIILPFTPDVFVRKSVSGVASGDWQARFHALWDATESRHREVMNLPDNDDAYARCNERILTRAASAGPFHLIALWNGGGGDGPGGTADMVARARAQNDEPNIVNPEELPR